MILINKRFGSLKVKWAGAFQEVEANYLLLVKEVSFINFTMIDLKQNIGTPERSGPSPPASVWDKLTQLSNITSTSLSKLSQGLQAMNNRVQTLVPKQRQLQNHIQTGPSAFI